ncbi:hypothetical protein [Streptomyces sp. NPDC002952]|uniref:hypothetical protein n=1 Tax=Streptomyces sp. NPDC002952 TaxID=3364673 RepID=UPI0036CD5DEE
MAPAPTVSARTGAPTAVAIIAPSPHADYTPAFDQRGHTVVGVTLPGLRPSDETATSPLRPAMVRHTGALRRTVRQLRGLGVAAVLAGSDRGVHLAERIAAHLALPGNNPHTTTLRSDCAAQAAALTAAGLAAPRALRTTSLSEALRWWEFSRLGSCLVLPAAAAATATGVTCATRGEIVQAWRSLRTTPTLRPGGDRGLILQEGLAGRRFLANSVTQPARTPGDTTEHVITEVWAQSHTVNGVLARTDLVRGNSLLVWALSRYMNQVLDALGIQAGPVRSTLAYTPDRGPVLLAASPTLHYTPADQALHQATGYDPAGAVLDSLLPPIGTSRIPCASTIKGKRVARIPLYAPAGSSIDHKARIVFHALPTVIHVDLWPAAGMPHHPASNPVGEVLLSSTESRDIEADYQVIRSLHSASLHTEMSAIRPGCTPVLTTDGGL